MAPPAAAPLLTTKLYLPPPRPARVPRARLARRLDQALRQHPVTLISAPAGFGKSALLAEWRASPAARTVRVAWLALDADDDDPTRFLTYLSAALAGLDPRLGAQARALLAEAEPPDAHAVIASLLAEVEACQAPGPNGQREPTQRWVLALDDYHLIQAPAVHAALAFLVEHLPPGLRLALLTRADPPLPLARWRARGWLAEFRAEALRFTPAETRRFCNQVMHLGLPAREVARLAAQTEGWAAALQLAALAIQGVAAPSRLAGFGARHAFLVDYLAGEVMAGLPAGTCRFLQATALLDRLCAPLCAALLGLPDDEAQARLQHLEQHNLFLIPLDGERRWYRYHHLFRDFLRGQWPAAQAAERRALHRRAAAWLEAHGSLEEAVHHWLQAEDYARLKTALPRAANELLAVGGNPTVLRWVQALPPHVFEHSPRLALTAAWVLALRPPANAGEIEPYLDIARRDPSPAILGETALIEAELARGLDQAPLALERAQRAYALLEGASPHLRALAALDVGTAHWWLGHWRAAAAAADLALATGRPAEHPAISARILTLLLPIRLGQGQLPAAAQACRALLEAVPAPYRLLRHAHFTLAEICLEWNDPQEAGWHLAAVLAANPLREPAAQTLAAREGHLLAARLALTQDDEAAARTALVQARPGRTRPGGAWAQRLDAREARLWLELGDRRAAWRAFAGGDSAHPSYTSEYEALTLARLHLAQGQPEAALECLCARLPAAEADGRLGHAAENLLLQALAEQALGQPTRATERLQHALALAEPGGYTRLFLAPGRSLRPPLAALLARAAARSAYAQRLLAAAERPGGAPQASPPAPPAPPVALPLIPGERRVVALIARGLSNDEIGRRLGISLNTVRTHNKSIFRKLDVSSRTQAAARAREAGLA